MIEWLWLLKIKFNKDCDVIKFVIIVCYLFILLPYYYILTSHFSLCLVIYKKFKGIKLL